MIDKEYYRIKAKEYYRRHRDEINERRRNRPSSLFHKIRMNANNRGIFIGITVLEFTKWFDGQIKKCIYCDIPIERLNLSDKRNKRSRSMGVDRLDNNKGYTLDNIGLCCIKCNFIKSNLFTYQEMKEIGQKYIKPKWQLSE